MAHQEKDLTWLVKLVKLLKEKRFYGKLEIVFQNGKIVHGQKHEVLKPE